MVDGSNESLYHADEEMHPLVRTFSPSQTIFQNLDVAGHKRVWVLRIQTIKWGAHFEALDKGVLVTALKSTGNFFAISKLAAALCKKSVLFLGIVSSVKNKPEFSIIFHEVLPF